MWNRVGTPSDTGVHNREFGLRQLGILCAMILTSLVLAPAGVSAQSAFSGVVRDTSGAVLPGVTVEAASPVLIEKTRNVVTDESGRYNMVDLRPGSFRLTFSLSGFSTLVRDGLDLPGNTTVTINADLRVGSLEESITVSGQAPRAQRARSSGSGCLRSPRSAMSPRPATPTSRRRAAMSPSLPTVGCAVVVSLPRRSRPEPTPR